jgi:hypothetical protein
VCDCHSVSHVLRQDSWQSGQWNVQKRQRISFSLSHLHCLWMTSHRQRDARCLYRVFIDNNTSNTEYLKCHYSQNNLRSALWHMTDDGYGYFLGFTDFQYSFKVLFWDMFLKHCLKLNCIKIAKRKARNKNILNWQFLIVYSRVV